MDATFWPFAAFILILLIFFIYSVLDGFDLGIGLVLPFIRDPAEKKRLLSLIAPFWDGNEVWLVMGAGLFFAAFPGAFATLLPAFYLPFMAVIGAYILRAVALEFSYHDPKREGFWRALFSAGSFGVLLIGLLALGHLLRGIPMSGPGFPAMTGRTLFAPFPIAFALLGIFIAAWHGLSYGRAHAAKGRGAFFGSTAAVALLWVAVGVRLHPFALPALDRTDWGLTLDAAAAAEPVLHRIVILCALLVPVILAYTVFIYRLLRKPASTPMEKI